VGSQSREKSRSLCVQRSVDEGQQVTFFGQEVQPHLLHEAFESLLVHFGLLQFKDHYLDLFVFDLRATEEFPGLRPDFLIL
jgi:hypothetical protein